MFRRNLKLLSFILLPITHILTPAIAMIVSLITLFSWFACISFCGHPLKPWRKINGILLDVWKKFKTEVKEYAENYGHESGIPNNWDGTVYGLAVDPLVIAIALFLYVIGVVSMCPLILVTFILKAVPMFVATLMKYWENGNGVKKAVTFYVDCIKKYSKFEIFTAYGKFLTEYCRSIERLDPSVLCEIMECCTKYLHPSKCIPDDMGIGILCLWFPILLAFFSWIIGLILVFTIPPVVFLVVLCFWIIIWPTVIIAPPMIYIGGKLGRHN